MLLQGTRDVAGSRRAAHRQENRSDSQRREYCHNSHHARADAHPAALRGHGRTEQKGKRGIYRHRIVFLSRRKSEKDKKESNPTERQETGASGAVDRFETETEHRRQERRPGKQPQKMQQPEGQARHGVVVARIAQVQEAKDMFVDEVKPKEAMILAGAAM